MALIILEPQIILPVLDCIKKRMEVIKNRLYKQNYDDWADYSEDGIIHKCRDASKEFDKLYIAEKEIREALVKQQSS
jgi:hypothetical protein